MNRLDQTLSAIFSELHVQYHIQFDNGISYYFHIKHWRHARIKTGVSGHGSSTVFALYVELLWSLDINFVCLLFFFEKII
jgi:hypothetical protein